MCVCVSVTCTVTLRGKFILGNKYLFVLPWVLTRRDAQFEEFALTSETNGFQAPYAVSLVCTLLDVNFCGPFLLKYVTPSPIGRICLTN